MTTSNHGARRPGERFKSWLERVVPVIYERLHSEMTDIAGLQADADTLATVIPELATALTTQQASLAQKEAELASSITEKEAAVAAAAADSAEAATAKEALAKAQGELAQVEAIKGELDPVVAQATSLVPAPAGETAAQEAEKKAKEEAAAKEAAEKAEAEGKATAEREAAEKAAEEEAAKKHEEEVAAEGGGQPPLQPPTTMV